MSVKSLLGLILALVWLTPTATLAQSAPEKYVVSFSVFKGGVRVFAPRIVMAVGSTASASVDGSYKISAALPFPSTPGLTSVPVSVVLSRANGGGWAELLSNNALVSVGKMTTIRPSSAPSAASGAEGDIRLTVSLNPVAAGAPDRTGTSARLSSQCGHAMLAKASYAPWITSRAASIQAVSRVGVDGLLHQVQNRCCRKEPISCCGDPGTCCSDDINGPGCCVY